MPQAEMGGEADIGEVEENLMKLSMQTAQGCREALAISTFTYIMPREHSIVLKMRAAFKDYQQAVKGVKHHDKGPPHLHVGAAALQEICSISLPAEANEKCKQVLAGFRRWAELVLAEPPEAVLLSIRHAQVADTHDRLDQPKLSKQILAFEGLIMVSLSSVNPTDVVFMTVN